MILVIDIVFFFFFCLKKNAVETVVGQMTYIGRRIAFERECDTYSARWKIREKYVQPIVNFAMT